MSNEVNSTGAQYAELLKSYSEAIVAAMAKAEADGGVDKVTYYDTQTIIYSKNGNKWEINWGD